MIYNIKKMNIKILALCLLLLLASCKKDEFQPEVEGAPIPTEDIKITLKEALDASSYTLFKAAWNRSDMNSIIAKRGEKLPLTIFVPTDAAFTADGLTLDVINRTTPALLDSLLLYHTLAQGIDPKTLSTKEESTVAYTLLENAELRVKPFENQYTFDKYFYRQYIKVAGNELLINGKKAGNATVTLAKNGTLWPIDHVLHKPTKTILQVLQEDGRFGMYLEIMTKMDMMWDEAIMGFVARTYFTEGLIVKDDPYKSNFNIVFTSIFAPTDEAFHEAGFKNVDDLMALNNRNTLPYINWDTYEVVGTGYATDTLLTMHRWGRLFQQQDGFGYGASSPDAFYSNDLTNKLLSDYALATSGYTGTIPVYYVPLDFSADNSGKIMVKAKGSTKPAATIIEADINTLMGPIHVVNRLMPPASFKY
jgi:uncharacterized surface protein with fasciclin (FAS1) repeats